MLNLNVGLLGHVDSGKTALAKALSTISSTASFDKHPQAQERGMTIDLGFSSFKIKSPPHLSQHFHTVQFTLVDCPGHASLISTVIGGAQIIDLMILVVDACKGVQTQTAECMVIAEITKKKVIIAINKVDLLKNKDQQSKIARKMRATVDTMSFKGSPVVCASAEQNRVQEVIDVLLAEAFIPARHADSPFLMAVDHCFAIQGKGTILDGKVDVGDEIEIPSIKLTKKIKSIQMFRKNVEVALQGDRVGLCVTQFDPKSLERGLVCKRNLLQLSYAAIMDFSKVRFHVNAIESRTRYHVCIGHETLLATIVLFSIEKQITDNGDIDFSRNYRYLASTASLSSSPVPVNGKEYQEQATEQIFALLEFDRPIIIAPSSWVIGARLDMEKTGSSCRMAFYGKLRHLYVSKNYRMDSLPALKVYKEKYREGLAERASDSKTVVARNMFKKSTDLTKFVGLAVVLSSGETGVIESGFGQSGKFKVHIPGGLKESTIHAINSSGKEGNAGEGRTSVTITLKHISFVFDKKKMLTQL